MLTKAEVQGLRSLRDKKHREAESLFVVEGPKVVGELLAAGQQFREIYATEAWQGSCTTRVSEEEMARISHFPTPSPVLALGAITRPELPAGALASGLSLALDGLQDPGNVGTLIRLADWYGVPRVLLSRDCADLYSQKVINASMGSFARVAVFSVDLPAVLEKCPVPVLGCDLDGDDVHQLGRMHDAVVVIGSEGRGPSPAVRERLSRLITIPRLGQAESLNAGVAAAIVLDNLLCR